MRGATESCQASDSTIPIVVQSCQDDMVAAGMVASLAHPGGNVTGISKAGPEWGAKKLQLLKEAIPSVSRVSVLWDPGYADWSADWGEVRRAAGLLGLRLESVEFRGADDLDRALSVVGAMKGDAVLSFSDVVTYVNARRVGEFAANNRLAWMSPFREMTAAGGLLSYGPNIPDLLRHSATFVTKILKGAKPADLPVEQPTNYEFVINLKTAKTLGLTIPPAVLARADDPMNPPIWLDAAGRPRPTLACWTCGREVAPMRFRARDLRRLGTAADAADPGLVRLFDGVPPGAGGR
jgi:putative ABC transport system substrate-binding protein